MMLRAALTAAAVSLATTSAAQVPNTFASGAPAKAAEVNANFTYLDGRVTALATELAGGVTIANTALSPVQIAGPVTVENTAASPVPVTGAVTVSNAAGSPVPVYGTVTVGNTPVPVTVSNASIPTYVSNGVASPVPVTQIGNVGVVAAGGPLPVRVQELPGLLAISVRFTGSNTSWISANVSLPSATEVVVESVMVRCPYAATVAMVGLGTSTAGLPSGVTATPLDAGSMTIAAASINAVWPTTTLAGTSVLPPTRANLPVGNAFSFWVGGGSGTIDCFGTVTVRRANSGF